MMNITKTILKSATHITLAPITYNSEKPARINYEQELYVMIKNEDSDVVKNICWYGDKKSNAKVGELFAFVHGFAKSVEDHGEGSVEFFEVVAILSPECAPRTWVDAKTDRPVLVLKSLNHEDTWCNVNELLGHARSHLNNGVVRTPFLTGMSRRQINK